MKQKHKHNKETIIKDLYNLGLKKGDLVNLKVSMKSIGPIKGGANTLIEALLDIIGETGTIVSEAFVSCYKLPLSKKNWKKISNNKTHSYAGIFVNTMVNHPKMFRSHHPIQKFVAIGHDAKNLMQNHTANNFAYNPLRIMSNKNAKNLNIGKDNKIVGVGTTHVAIKLAGLKQKKQRNLGINYINKNGDIKLFKINWPEACVSGFRKFLPLYKNFNAILSEGKLGDAYAKTTSMKKTLKIEITKLLKTPEFILCYNPGCKSCRLKWTFSKGNYIMVNFYNIMNKIKNNSLKQIISMIIYKIKK
ncbi:AAC(3) family N-acetyltransferase [Patescibacteria group bacterium]|nr:AAC(3) family N-acetyltransferase [Patescibacteria group bacterium]